MGGFGGMGGYGGGMGGGMMGGMAEMIEKKMKMMKMLKMIKKLSMMVIGPDAGATGNLMDQWKMFLQKMMGKMKDGEMDKEMGTMLGYLWEMTMGDDMGYFWDKKEDKEAMKVKVEMLMKKLTSMFKKVMGELKGQMQGWRLKC